MKILLPQSGYRILLLFCGYNKIIYIIIRRSNYYDIILYHFTYNIYYIYIYILLNEEGKYIL